MGLTTVSSVALTHGVYQNHDSLGGVRAASETTSYTAGCLAPSPRESGVPKEDPALHICWRGDGSAIYAVGRGVPRPTSGRVALPRDRMESRHLGGALGQRASRPLRLRTGRDGVPSPSAPAPRARAPRAPNQLANRSRWMASSFADGWNLMAGRMRVPSYVLKVWWKISLVA